MTKGSKMSAEQRARVSRAMIGRTLSAEHRAAVSAGLRGNTNCLGHIPSQEMRAKLSASTLGKPGKSPTVETRAKISRALIGRSLSPEHCAKLSAARKGRALSPCNRAKLLAANTGRVYSAETLAKMAEAQVGKKASLETRAKQSAASLGKPKSPKHRARLAEANRAPRSIETRAKLSAASLGRVRSAETREKLSASMSRRWALGQIDLRIKNRYTLLARVLNAYLGRTAGLILEHEVRFGRFTVDLYDREHHVAYEADGSYWHVRAEKNNSGQQQRRDEYLLNTFGLKIVHVTDVELMALVGVKNQSALRKLGKSLAA